MLRSGDRGDQEVGKFQSVIRSFEKCCLSNGVTHTLMCSGTPPCIKIVISKMPRCWNSGITRRHNNDFKRTKVTVHVTGPAVDYSSKQIDPIMKLVVIPHKTETFG